MRSQFFLATLLTYGAIASPTGVGGYTSEPAHQSSHVIAPRSRQWADYDYERRMQHTREVENHRLLTQSLELQRKAKEAQAAKAQESNADESNNGGTNSAYWNSLPGKPRLAQ